MPSMFCRVCVCVCELELLKKGTGQKGPESRVKCLFDMCQFTGSMWKYFPPFCVNQLESKCSVMDHIYIDIAVAESCVQRYINGAVGACGVGCLKSQVFIFCPQGMKHLTCRGLGVHNKTFISMCL